MPSTDTEYLTTKELAALLRIKERKVYDLAATGKIPCSRAMGKLLFPRQAVEAWIAGENPSVGTTGGLRRPAVFLGSYEPLLEWALLESGSGLATLLDGSTDGLMRFVAGEGMAAGLHVYDPVDLEWNIRAVETHCAQQAVVLLEFAWRERGLIVAPNATEQLGQLSSLCGKRVVPRQPGAGTQVLIEHLLAEAGVSVSEVEWTDAARTESEAALAVLDGRADAALGLRALAEQLRLGFIPLLRERYDMLVDRAAWFDPPLQRLANFCRSEDFANKAAQFAGYDVSGLGTVRFNAK